MRRARITYLSALCSASLLFGVGTSVAPGSGAAGAVLGVARFVILSAAAVSAVVTWGAAVHMASVHRVAWPLVVAVTLVVGTAGTFLLTAR